MPTVGCMTRPLGPSPTSIFAKRAPAGDIATSAFVPRAAVNIIEPSVVHATPRGSPTDCARSAAGMVGASYVRCGFRSLVVIAPPLAGTVAMSIVAKMPSSFGSKRTWFMASQPTAVTEPLGATPIPDTVDSAPPE